MTKFNRGNTPLKSLQDRHASSRNVDISHFLEDEDDEDALFNSNNNGFVVPHPVEVLSSTLFGTVASTHELVAQLETIDRLLGMMIKEHGGDLGGSKPSEQFLFGFHRSGAIYVLRKVVPAIIQRVDSAGDESIDRKIAAIFNKVFYLFSLMVAPDTREMAIKIAQQIIDSLDIAGRKKIFCEDQADENRIGYVQHYPDELSAIDANNYVTTEIFFTGCAILTSFPGIGAEYKNKTVNLLVSLAGRIQQNQLEFFTEGAVGKVEKLLMLRKVDNTFLSKAHVQALMVMVNNITTGATLEATAEAAAEAETEN